MEENGVDYEYIDVDLLEGEEREKVIEEVINLTRGLNFPTVVINGKVIVGYDEDRLREVLNI